VARRHNYIRQPFLLLDILCGLQLRSAIVGLRYLSRYCRSRDLGGYCARPVFYRSHRSARLVRAPGAPSSKGTRVQSTGRTCRTRLDTSPSACVWRIKHYRYLANRLVLVAGSVRSNRHAHVGRYLHLCSFKLNLTCGLTFIQPGRCAVNRAAPVNLGVRRK